MIDKIIHFRCQMSNHVRFNESNNGLAVSICYFERPIRYTALSEMRRIFRTLFIKRNRNSSRYVRRTHVTQYQLNDVRDMVRRNTNENAAWYRRRGRAEHARDANSRLYGEWKGSDWWGVSW